MVGKKHDLAQRVQALTFLDMGMKIEDVERITGYSWNLLYNLKKQAIKISYDPTITPLIYNMHVENTHKNKRPSISLEKQLEILPKLQLINMRRKINIWDYRKIEVFKSSIVCIRKKQEYKKINTTWKLDLTYTIMKVWLEFAVKYKN